MLADMNSPLDPPNASFTSHSSPNNSPYASRNESSSNLSLTVNYIPSKFSAALLSPGGPRRRKNAKDTDVGVPKRGGGVDAFRSGEARIPGAHDEDELDGGSGWFGGKEGGKTKQKLRWNKFKWTMFFANILVGLFLFPSPYLFC